MIMGLWFDLVLTDQLGSTLSPFMLLFLFSFKWVRGPGMIKILT